MNTVVFVLMIYSHGGNWAPTMEFSSQQKCEKAAIDIKAQVDPRISFLGKFVLPLCVRIEK